MRQTRASSFREVRRLVEGAKGVLLDLDGTLYSYERCHKKALRAAWKEARKGKNISFQKFEEAYREARAEVKKHIPAQAACHSRVLYFQRYVEKEEGALRTGRVLAMEEAYWKNFLSAMRARKGAQEFLLWCKKAGKPVVIVTDMTARIQMKKIQRLGLDGLLRAMASSEEAGAEKPDRPIFALALRKLGMRAEDVIMIGDAETKDAKGAELAGIPSVVMEETQ